MDVGLPLPGGRAVDPSRPGAAISVDFTLGVQMNGRYRFAFDVEALP